MDVNKVSDEIKRYVQCAMEFYQVEEKYDAVEECFLLFFMTQILDMSYRESWNTDVLKVIEKLVVTISRNPEYYINIYDSKMYSPIGMIAFSFHEITRKTGELKAESEYLNNLLLENAIEKTRAFHKEKVSFATYDILSGISGVVYYLLDCADIMESVGKRLEIRSLLRFLIYLSEDYVYKGKQILRYHIRRKYQLLKSERQEMKKGHINFGTAHGLMGPLVTLAKAKKNKMLEEKQEDAIGKLFGLYEQFCIEKNGISFYPRRLSVEDYVDGKSSDLTENSGWCYGNLGIVRGLMKAACYREDGNAYCDYLNKFVKIIEQPIENYHLCSPILCHGYGSVVSLQMYAFRESKDERCLTNLERNMEMLLKEHKKKMEENEGYKFDLSILDGSAGVVLTMQNYITKNLTYGKLLFMD